MRGIAVALVACLALAACSGGGEGSTATAPATSASDTPTASRTTDGEVDGWPTTTPAAAGLRADRLARVARHARSKDSTCFAVVRDGELVRDWNWGADRTAPREVFSVTKSITSALVGIAVRDGDLRLGDRVARYVPAWRGTPSAKVTVRHLLSNDSGRFWSFRSDYVRLSRAADRTAYAIGLDQQFRPGSAWAYNNAAIQVLDRVLSAATGTPTDELAAARLFEPLGMTHTRLTRDQSARSTNVYYGAQTTCLDLARFARLYLHGGAVDGVRVLDRDYVRSSIGRSSTRLNAAYGHLWWLNRYGVLRGSTDAVGDFGEPEEEQRGRLVPDAPASLFSALGFAGQIAMVDPTRRTIVVRLGPASAGDYTLRDAARVVTWAARS